MVVCVICLGVVFDEFDCICYNYIIAYGGDSSSFNYYGFSKFCCIFVNEVICYGIFDVCLFEKGDIVNIDVMVYIYGYYGDLNEIVFVGKFEDVDEKLKYLFKVVLECLW